MVKSGKIIIIITILALVSSYFIFDLSNFFSLGTLKEKYSYFNEFYNHNQLLTISLFFAIYLLMAGLSLPGATVMTVAAGAIFGLITGVVIVSFASTLGATLAFLISRFLIRESVQKKFGNSLKGINDGLEKEGAFYLFSLRLVPVFPFFIINLVMGLTTIKTSIFMFSSQIGMLAGTIVFVNAGRQLSQIESLGDILSPGLVISFVLAGLFPLLAKWTIGLIKNKRLQTSQN